MSGPWISASMRTEREEMRQNLWLAGRTGQM